MEGGVMTRKDYQALAKAFGVALNMAESVGGDALLGFGHALDQVGAVLAVDNPRFDWGRFEAAMFEARDIEAAYYGSWD
jgi:hypothetical protein